jgi:hypothetical protein
MQKTPGADTPQSRDKIPLKEGEKSMPRRVTALKEAQVVNAKPEKEASYRMFDGGGLFLFVTPSGGKLWRLKYRYEGKERLLSLGAYPEISLEDARQRRDEARELIKQKIDPSERRKEEKAIVKAERLEADRTPSVRVSFDGKIEIWKGGNMLRLTRDEALFISTMLTNILRGDDHAIK